MKNIFTTLLLSTILLTNGVAQQISATAYNKAIIHEDFSTEGDFFPIVTTTENYFILDKGDYLLSRNNEDSEYAIIASNSSVNNFILKTSVRIGPSNNKTASVGIIIKAQQDGKGAIIFEINKKGEYRIKQLLGNTYKTLSGSSKQEGWVKNKTINEVDEHNFIEIRTENNIYDVYVNSDFLTTFFIPDYTSGSCGIIISPGTKARIAYYYINTKGGDKQLVATYTNENITNVNATIEELNKKIETLEKNNATLNNLNTEARENQDEEMSKLTQKNADLAAITIEQEKEIASLERSITDLKSNNSKIEGLEKTISDNTTLISKLNTEKNTLTNNVATLTETTTRLNTKNTELASVTIKQKKEISSLKNSTTNTNSTISNLNTKNKEFTSKINSLTIKNTDLAAITIEKEKEIKLLSTTITNLIFNNSDATTSNKELTVKAAALKEQIALEKSRSTALTKELNKTNNDLNKTTKSLNTNSTQLNNEISILKETVSTVKKEKSSLNSDLIAEKKAHSNTKSRLAESEKNKSAEVKTLKTQLKKAKKNNTSLAECTANSANLTANLSKATEKINALRAIKNNQNNIVLDLNSQLSLLKANLLQQKEKLKKQNQTITKLETKNIELKKVFIRMRKTNYFKYELADAELKELFILKDFEVNGAKPFNLTKQTNSHPVPTPKEIENGNSTIYTVQFGVYMQVQPYSALKGLDEVWYETTEHETYVYLSGQFKSPLKATEHKNSLIALGYTNAFVVTLTK